MSLTKEQLETAKQRFEEYDKLCDLYNEDPRFKLFVDRTCKMYGLHKDVALLHKIVQNVGKYYIDNPNESGLEAYVLKEDYAEDKAC